MPIDKEISKPKRTEPYDPKKIKTPQDVIKDAKQCYEKIEKAAKKYGPGTFTKLRQKSAKENDAKNFWRAIKEPCETLYFYSWYYYGTENFKEIQNYVDKTEKYIDNIKKKSHTFNDYIKSRMTLNSSKFIEFAKTKATILKDNQNQNAEPKIFANFCADVLNEKLHYYQEAHDKLSRTKHEKAQKNSNYEIIRALCTKLRKTLKNDFLPFKNKINNLVEKAHQKKHTFQFKTFSSNELSELISKRDDFDNNYKKISQKISKFSPYKYNTYAKSVLKHTNHIDNMYYNTEEIYTKLCSGELKSFDAVKEKLEELNEEVAPYTDLIDVQASGENLTDTQINKITKKINKFQDDLNSILKELSGKIKKINEEIDKFDNSYSTKAWAIWIGKGGTKFLLKEIGKINSKVGIVTDILEKLVDIIPDGY